MAQTDGVADHAAPEDEPDAVADTAAAPVEPKVKAATVATVTSLLVWMLGAYVFRGVVPLPVEGGVGLLSTGLCTFGAGYLARHVNR